MLPLKLAHFLCYNDLQLTELVLLNEAPLQLLHEGEVVTMEVPTPAPVVAAAYPETFGMFHSDPTFVDFLQEVDAYRRIHNQHPAE